MDWKWYAGFIVAIVACCGTFLDVPGWLALPPAYVSWLGNNATATQSPTVPAAVDAEENQITITLIPSPVAENTSLPTATLTPTSTPQPTPTATAIPDTPTATLTPTATHNPQPTPTPTLEALPSGSTVNTEDGWALRVVEVKYSDRVDDGNLIFIAEGRYVHLILEVTNNNRRKETFIASGNLELLTGSGLSYRLDDYANIINDEIYGIEWQNRPSELRPGEKGFEVVTFDIPIDSYGPYMLQGGLLKDLDAKVLVDIQ